MAMPLSALKALLWIVLQHCSIFMVFIFFYPREVVLGSALFAAVRLSGPGRIGHSGLECICARGGMG